MNIFFFEGMGDEYLNNYLVTYIEIDTFILTKKLL